MGEFQAHSIWFNAIAQHYGPGSDFLDVTHSVEVALWFALNADEQFTESGVIGPDGSPDPARDHVITTELLRFRPWEGTGYLYAFDVPKWSGESALATAGVLVDLAEAPEVFSSSPRMRAQSACLIYCRNPDGSHLDMRTHLVAGASLLVRRPVTGVTGLECRTCDIFPSPAIDKWYSKFLCVPMSYAPRLAPPTLRRSIPVTVYADPENEAYTEETRCRDVALPSPLIHQVVGAMNAAQATSAAEGLEKLTPIVLEAPMKYPYAPGDSIQWHHGLLWSDVPRSCTLYDLDDLEQCGEVSLLNVLFEFSLLEDVGWDRLVEERKSLDLLRGVWRTTNEVSVAFVSQMIRVRGLGCSDFMSLTFDPPSQQIMFRRSMGGHESLVPIASEPHLAKPILIALMLLRYLSPALKAEPLPQLTVGDKMIVAYARDAARLFQVQTTHSTWFVLRDRSNPAEPFTRPTSDDGGLQLNWSEPFQRMPLDELRNAVADGERARLTEKRSGKTRRPVERLLAR